MSIEHIPDETELKVYNLLARATKPKAIQEIADEIQRDYDDTLKYVLSIGERRAIRLYNQPDGLQAVGLLTGVHH